MDELKILLKNKSIDYSETELVINAEGVEGGPPNSTIVNLNTVFVSLMYRSKNCHNFFILHPIVKTLTPLESSQLSGSDDMHHYLTSQKLAVCPVRKLCYNTYHQKQESCEDSNGVSIFTIGKKICLFFVFSSARGNKIDFFYYCCCCCCSCSCRMKVQEFSS